LPKPIRVADEVILNCAGAGVVASEAKQSSPAVIERLSDMRWKHWIATLRS